MMSTSVVSHGDAPCVGAVGRAAGPRWGRPAGQRSGEVAGGQASRRLDTGTPLVSTSKTAERALDCSTIARSFSAGASPAILKLTRIAS